MSAQGQQLDTRIDLSTKADKVADAGDLERIRQAAERRARKVQKQARGFKSTEAGKVWLEVANA